MHWLWTLWYGYTYPSLRGNGPEAIVQTLVYAAIAFVLVPPVRKYINAHVKSLHDKLDAHHAEHLDLLKKQHKSHLAAIRQTKENHE